MRVLRVKPGDRGEQFASDITGDRRQVFIAKDSGQVVAYGRVIELPGGQAGPGTPAGWYLSGVLVDPAWRRRGIATELTRARLRWAFARTGLTPEEAGPSWGDRARYPGRRSRTWMKVVPGVGLDCGPPENWWHC